MKRYNEPRYDDLGMQEDDDGDWCKWEDVSSVIDGYKMLVEAHEKRISDLKDRRAGLEVTLKSYAAEALEDVNHWAGYASEYFADKHNLAGDILKWSQRSEGKNEPKR